jgi:HAD superfamily hydrolase (TIGR01509 family)
VRRPELVIFDNDGVLVDSERLANGILAGLLTEAGVPYTLEQAVHEFMGGTMARVRASVEPRLGHALPADFEDRYHERLFEGFARLEPVAGVPEVLDALDAAALAYCVASSGTHERIRTALSAVGLYGRFEGRVFSAHDVEHGKPAPDLFLYAASTMTVDPAGCTVVEDSPLGVEAARAAGMTVVGYAGMTPVERLAAADVVIDKMGALPGLFALS